MSVDSVLYRHWKARAEKAEAEAKRLREALTKALEVIRDAERELHVWVDRDRERHPGWPDVGYEPWNNKPSLALWAVDADEVEREARAALSATPVAPAWDKRGGPVWLSREQWGMVFDGLMMFVADARRRKAANPASVSDLTAAEAEEVMGIIRRAALAATPVASFSPHRDDCPGRFHVRDSAYCDLCNPGWRDTEWGRTYSGPCYPPTPVAPAPAATERWTLVPGEDDDCPRCGRVKLRWVPPEYEPGGWVCDDCGWDSRDSRSVAPAPAATEPRP